MYEWSRVSHRTSTGFPKPKILTQHNHRMEEAKQKTIEQITCTHANTHAYNFVHTFTRPQQQRRAIHTTHDTHTQSQWAKVCSCVRHTHTNHICLRIYWITTNTHTHTSSTTPCKRPYVCLVGAAAIHFYMLWCVFPKSSWFGIFSLNGRFPCWFSVSYSNRVQISFCCSQCVFIVCSLNTPGINQRTVTDTARRSVWEVRKRERI